MVSYAEAKAASDLAFQLVSNLGLVVLTVRPKESNEGWFVSVETARSLPDDFAEKITANGVPIIISDCGLPPPRRMLR